MHTHRSFSFQLQKSFLISTFFPFILVASFIAAIYSFMYHRDIQILLDSTAHSMVSNIRTYMNGISDSLEESAQLDGAGYTTIFLKIISPLCKPVYATVALFVAVGQWNSWFDAMLYNRMSANLTTLQYELMKLLSSVTNQGNSVEAMKNAAGSVTPTSVRAAATILTMLPIICLYPFLQRYFVTGLTIGGVKE